MWAHARSPTRSLSHTCVQGGADNSSTIMILGCDLICLSFGITSACLDRKSSSRHMLGYFFAAGFFYVFMMMALHDQVSQGSALLQPQWVQDLFYKLEVLTAVSWSCYPIVVFFGRVRRYTQPAACLPTPSQQMRQQTSPPRYF